MDLQMHSRRGSSLTDMSTIAQVAARANVSRTTVSHVVNHSDRVSKALRERVEKVIAELGYAPNPQARSLRTGRTNIVAMLIADIVNPFFPELVKTAQSELEQVGLDMLVFNTDVPGGHSQAHARDYLRQISRKRVDGLIIGDVALHGMSDAHEALRQLEVPAVVIGYLRDNVVDNVRVDSEGGAYRMGVYLAQKGHGLVAHVTGPAVFDEAVARARGFERGLAEHGVAVPPALRIEGTYLQPSGRDAIQRVFEAPPRHRPTAIFFANYLMVVGALAELHDRGIRSPEDIALAVFDDSSSLEYVRPKLTCVGVSPSVLARRAAEMLIERLNGNDAMPARSETLPCAFRIGLTA
jgi:DNA-binding LacI/PurR family transcriptional regulator